MIICLSHNLFDVTGFNYYVSQGGDDSNNCRYGNCKTLQAANIKVDINYAAEFTVFIRDQTTLSSTFELSQTFPSPRTFSNNPDFVSRLSDIHIQQYGQFIVTGNALFQMIIFTKLDQATYNNGGAINAQLTKQSSNLQIDNCLFYQCKAVSNGGGLNLFINYPKEITLKTAGSRECEAQNEGGALWCSINNGAKLTLPYLWSFTECKTLSDSGYGGAFYASVNGENSQLIFEDIVIFERCSGQTGGGMFMKVQSGGSFTITLICHFTNCSSSNSGGGLYLETNNGTVNFNPTEHIVMENCTCDGSGGGIYCLISNNGQMQVNNTKFKNCSSQGSGGGIYASIESKGQLILDKACLFYQCESHGNGGGIYIRINFTAQFLFLIKDALIHQCKSLNSTNSSLSYPESGFGGGLFLGCDGDYDPSTEMIDLRGMNIYDNIADKYGQSIYIAMRDFVRLCQYGTQGEFVIGNYSNGVSNQYELWGISLDLSTFNSSSPQTIEQQQQPIELLWGTLGILNRAQVFVNVSNPNGKLIFQIEGQRMIPGQLNVKIFELQTENQQQVSIRSNSRIERNLRIYDNEMIYPPEDGSSVPISIEGEIESEQTGSFGMNDYKWLNYKQKVYGIVISNDRNIFTGKDGLTIEEDENVAVQLEVIIEEEAADDESEIVDPQQVEEQEEKEGKGLTVGIIVSIAVGALIIVSVIITIIIVTFVISKKIKKIGKGAFGTVWKMKEIRSQRIVAVKEVDYDSDEEKQRFHKEVSVMRDVYHILQQASSSSQSSDSQPPFIHVVEPLGYFLNEDKDKAYLVLEYCENGDLRQYIQSMKNFGTEISEAKAFELIRQVTLALNQLHINGIIHGDIKPENILLTKDFQVKLSDFGLTRKLQEDRGYTTNHGGTTFYLAPEILHGESARGKRMKTIATDIWSFGVMLFELLAQKHPFFNSDDIELSPLEVYNRIIDEEPTDLPDHYSNNLKRLIRQMLVKDATRRITVEAILEDHDVATSKTKN
ncbi:MAG: putative NEK protein kinase [Streblomastix strix]|uniref:Putative NEK protein kinase n=1 Tax=Streblomastix strix TaxID=222440 RepID=A0A5J4VRU0_9EUKA|nr:MAG: putative NEK protein kinase [Streblomastix strix]